jgi:GNAT superfamily N-acetyltransferase
LAEIVIRGYRDEDREACRRLWTELTQWHRDIYDDPGIGGLEPGLHFDEHLKKAGVDRILVAEDGNTIVGLIGYLADDEEIEIEPLVVSTSHRGRGIGSSLLNSVIQRAKNTNIKYISVRPVVRNERALAFFRSRGFDKVGRVELFIDCKGSEWKKDLRLFELDFGY